MQSCLWRGINQDQIPIKWDGGEEEGEDNGDKLPLNRPVNMQSISLQLEVFCIFSYYVGQIHCKQYTTNVLNRNTRCLGVVYVLHKTKNLHTPGV